MQEDVFRRPRAVLEREWGLTKGSDVSINQTEPEGTPIFWAAPELIDAGYKVFPVDSKAPTVEGGWYAGTVKKSQVAAWIEAGREHHDIGVPTGVFGEFVAIDADTPEAFEEMKAEFGPPAYTTRRGGHWLFGHPRNGKVSSTNKFAPGLDRKGDLGYVIFPPSKGRKWTNGIPRPEDLPELPRKFWSKSKGPTPGERKAPQDRKDAAAAVIAEHVRGITPETPGAGRHDHLRHLCGVLLGKEVSLVDSEDILKAAWGKVGGDLSERLDSEIPNTLNTTQAAMDAGNATGIPSMERITPGLYAALEAAMKWPVLHATTNGSTSTNPDDIHSFNPKSAPLKRKNIFLTPREILAEAGETPPWICEPWVARGGVTDVAGAAKLAGKTTFAMCMVRSILHGERFMGHKTEKTPVVLLTEQGGNISKAFSDAGISEDTEGLYVLPRRLTLEMKWPEIVAAAVEKCKEVEAKLLIVDTLPRFAGLEGEKENNAGDVMKAMTPLIDAAQEHDIGVWSIRHANHEGRGRGSTAFLHDVDIVLTMRLPDATLPSNIRAVEAHGRYDGIPPKTNIEFKDGRYYDLGTDSRVQANRAREAALDTLASGREVPSAELMDRAAKDAGTSAATVNTEIGKLVDEGRIERKGRGVKGDPYRYIHSFNRGGTRDKKKKEAEPSLSDEGHVGEAF
jgi:hypothetical protein